MNSLQLHLNKTETILSKKETILSKRELEILNLIAFEFNSSEIASSLFISIETVKTHRKNMLRKMNVKNVAGLVRAGIVQGLIQKTIISC